MIIFTLGPVTLTTATVSGFVAVFTFTYGVWRRGQQFGFNTEKLFDFSLVFLASGGAGFLVTPYLGAILSVLVGYLYLNKQKYSWRKISRVVAPVFFLSGAIFFAGFLSLTLTLLFAIFGITLLVFEQLELFMDAAFFCLAVLFLSGLQIYWAEGPVVLSVSIILFGISAMTALKLTRNPELTKELLQQIKDKLQRQEKDIKDELRDLEGQDPYHVPGRESYDPEEDVLEDQEHERLEILKGRLRSSLNQVQKALSAIKSSNYGTCQKCGKPISKERLLAHSATELCRECAEEENGSEG